MYMCSCLCTELSAVIDKPIVPHHVAPLDDNKLEDNVKSK